MNAESARDPYLDLPLDGVRLIEASAGTGKTFTLATLVTRLVVERGLRVGQVLAVTFTEAATQELRKRIRERLLLALELVDAPAVDGEDAEAALTRDILQAHLARSGEPAGALRRRLRQAALEIDLAAIFTIHGFCARVLREHALESGQGFDPPELLANDRALREELAADLWRTHGASAAGGVERAQLGKSTGAGAKDGDALGHAGISPVVSGRAHGRTRAKARRGGPHPIDRLETRVGTPDRSMAPFLPIPGMEGSRGAALPSGNARAELH